ncbi:MAG: hypothetical protein JWN14_3532 [Chthonomonadales bacterium]|nr:hypothetical protein [Chthonomonadales bacterium]
MISDKEFSNGFADFWTRSLPYLTLQLFAELNAKGNVRLKGRRNWIKPMDALNDSSTNDIVSEAAFELFSIALNQGFAVQDIAQDKNQFDNIILRAIERTDNQRLKRGKASQKVEDVPASEAIQLAIRLDHYFSNHPSERPIAIQPLFKGCGILDTCFGDILTPGHLYELKMVDRNLRSTDIRQVLTYCTLNHFSGQYDISNAVILNPRRGSEYTFNIEELVSRTSGKTAPELFQEIMEFLLDLESKHQDR